MALRLAKKYPLRQEHTPIKGSPKQSVFIAKTERGSPTNLVPIKLLKVIIIAVVITAKNKDSPQEILSTFFAPVLSPKESLSVIIRVTAVEIPEVAKVDAKT
jgi:hypothetical protein